MHAAHKKLAILESAVGILEIDLPLTDRLDLGAGQLDASLVFLLDELVMPCFFVGRDLFGALLGHSAHGNPSFSWLCLSYHAKPGL